MPILSIAIPTHYRPQLLERLLESILRQSLQAKDYEVIVVTNEAADTAKSVVRSFQECAMNITLYCCQRKSIALARNLALQKAQSPLVYFVDDDCELSQPDHLKSICEIHNKYPLITAIGGGYSSPKKAPFLVKRYNQLVNGWLKWNQHHLQYVQLPGGNACYKKQWLDGQTFNPDFTHGGEETDFHLRLQQAGQQVVFLPQLNILHHFTGQWQDIALKAFWQGQAKKQWVTQPKRPHLFITFYKTFKELHVIDYLFIGYYQMFVLLGTLTPSTKAIQQNYLEWLQKLIKTKSRR